MQTTPPTEHQCDLDPGTCDWVHNRKKVLALSMAELEVLQIGLRKAREFWHEKELETANCGGVIIEDDTCENVMESFWSAHVRDGDKL
jgi:hypothetical protein